MKQNIKKATWTLVLMATSSVYAVEDVLEGIQDYLTGPLGSVICGISVIIAGILYTGDPDRHVGKLKASMVGSLVVMLGPRIVQLIRDFG